MQTTTRSTGHPLPPGVQAALDAGQLIDAIKRLRAATGLGLKEAKDIIDAHQLGEAVHLPTGAAAPGMGMGMGMPVLTRCARHWPRATGSRRSACCATTKG